MNLLCVCSAFLVCVLFVCFVYGLCIVFVCFQCVFMNLLRALLRLSCVLCMFRIGCVCVSFLYIANTFSHELAVRLFLNFVCFVYGSCIVFAYFQYCLMHLLCVFLVCCVCCVCLVVWLFGCVFLDLFGCLFGCFFACLVVGLLFGCLFVFLVVWLCVWLIVWLRAWLLACFGCLVCWLFGCLFGSRVVLG